MNISSKNNYKPNFESANFIQVSKKAFKEPENLTAVYSEFASKSRAAVGEPLEEGPTMLVNLGLGKFINKLAIYLEQPTFILLKKQMQKSGIKSFEELKQKIGIDVKDAINPDYHSFFVFTKEEKNAFCTALNGINQIKLNFKLMKEMFSGQKNLNPKYSEPAWLAARLNQYFSDKAQEIIAGKEIHKFKIENLDEIPDTFQKIDY